MIRISSEKLQYNKELTSCLSILYMYKALLIVLLLTVPTFQQVLEAARSRIQAPVSFLPDSNLKQADVTREDPAISLETAPAELSENLPPQ